MSVLVATARQAGFIPSEIVCREFLSVLRAQLGLAAHVRRDTDFSPVGNGDVISVPYPGVFAARNKTSGAQTTVTRPLGGTKVQVTIDKHRYVDTIVEDAARVFSNAELLRGVYLTPMAIALAEQVEIDIAAELMQLTNTLGTAGTDLTDAIVRTAGRDLSVRKIDKSPANRRLVLHPKDEAAILGSTNLANYLAWSAASAVKSGDAPPIYGFTPMMTQIAPQTGVARLVFTGGTNGTIFRLTFNGFQTADITFSTTAATLATNIQNALVALTDPIAMTGLASASGSGTGPWTVDVTFSGAALRYGSLLGTTVEGVSGTAYDGSIASSLTGTVTTTNFAIHPEAAIFVPRMFQDIPANAGVDVSQLTDTESGLSFRLILNYDVRSRAVGMNIDMLYGVKRLRDVAGIRLLG